MNLEAVWRFGFVCRLEQPCAQRHHLFVGCMNVVDPQVEMDLLRIPVGPLGRNMIRRKLDAHPGLAFYEHHVPIVFGVDGAPEESGLEAAPRAQVGRVEHNDLVVDSHTSSFQRNRNHQGADQRNCPPTAPTHPDHQGSPACAGQDRCGMVDWTGRSTGGYEWTRVHC